MTVGVSFFWCVRVCEVSPVLPSSLSTVLGIYLDGTENCSSYSTYQMEHSYPPPRVTENTICY